MKRKDWLINTRPRVKTEPIKKQVKNTAMDRLIKKQRKLTNLNISGE